ncbi:PAS domain-containing protein [Halalkalibacter akibai]|uniref:Diguanylate cyclase/phosphodiesterase n=1 Tax=Halalkalibacter akibai (strain ATCC 43226 / DSM 21942 / CIP 109018 / JCM 9157 / 1139) TaxID=1236973 RepID=W4QUH9_HALA3|nr:PAS domain-containing protein [Halalkalibacter akibai]GAE34969.1 diguanylate cyclase/phosphodiesterase [Halalkalibacter akibai JCM 9157]
MSSVLRNYLRKLNCRLVIDLAELETFKKLFNFHNDFIFIFDSDGIILETNDEVKRVTGYDKEEWIDKPFAHFKTIEEQKKFNESLSLLKKGEPQVELCSLLHKQGHKIQFEKTSIPISHQNQIIGFLGIGRDISMVSNQELELRKVQESLNRAQLIGNTGSWDYDVEEDEAYWSNHMYEMFGIKDKKTFIPTYSSFLSFVHPYDRERFDSVFQKALQHGTGFQIEFQINRNDEERIVSKQGDVIFDENGKVVRLIGTIQDLTEQRKLERLLKDSEDQKRLIYDNLEVAIWSVDVKNDQVMNLTKGFERIYGYSIEEMKRDRDLWKKVIHPDDFAAVLKKQENLFQGKAIRHHYRIYHSSGVIKWVLDHVIPVMDNDGEIIRLDGFISDITEQKQAEEKMSYLAHHDVLTGLPNRRMFNHTLRRIQETESDEMAAILYFNLDRFKHINDTLGHLIGDELLKEVSKRLRSLVPEKEGLSRMNGDEFAIFIFNVDDASRPEVLADNILKLIRDPFLIEGYELYITVSIGISIFRKNNAEMDVLNKSIAAMNRVKQLGKNHYQIYSQTMGERSVNIYSIENDMRKALKNDEFLVYYQHVFVRIRE